MQNHHTHAAWLALKVTFGVIPIVAGLDKFFNVLTQWPQYLSSAARALLPTSDIAFMHIVGIVEIVVGILVLSKWGRVGAYLACIWLILIALNLLATGRYFDIAVRDVALAVGAFALAQLQQVQESESSSEQRHHAPGVESHAHG